MSRPVIMLGLVISIALFSGITAAEPNLNPGKWEISTEMDMPGMPMKIPPVTHTQCLTKEDFVPKGKDASDQCRVSDLKQDGDTVSWKISCSGEGGKIEGSGQMTLLWRYHGRHHGYGYARSRDDGEKFH